VGNDKDLSPQQLPNVGLADNSAAAAASTLLRTKVRAPLLLTLNRGLWTLDFLMPLKILVVPDKFKGTLTAGQAARVIADGWRKARPRDVLELLPMCDGGDGFGEVMAGLFSAEVQVTRALDAAHRPIEARWWWAEKRRTALIESAEVIGLARLQTTRPQDHKTTGLPDYRTTEPRTPHRRQRRRNGRQPTTDHGAKKPSVDSGLHPFGLDTFGLGAVLVAAAQKGARRCLVGIGGSATNDGGFGLARALGWRFLDREGRRIERWTELRGLAKVQSPSSFVPVSKTTEDKKSRVRSPLSTLGLRSCSWRWM